MSWLADKTPYAGKGCTTSSSHCLGFLVSNAQEASCFKCGQQLSTGLPLPLQVIKVMPKGPSGGTLGCWLPSCCSGQRGYHSQVDLQGLAMDDWRGPSSLNPTTSITSRKLQVVIMVSRWPVFILDTRAAYLVLMEFWETTSPSCCPIVGVEGQPYQSY